MVHLSINAMGRAGVATIEGLTLVTGGTGFLGGRVLARLVADGTPVRALVRRPLPPHLVGFAMETWLGDLQEARMVAGVCNGVDTVIHCAGLVTDYAPYRQYMQVNGTGTATLLEDAKRARVRRFVHVSTTDVYGYPSTPQPESAPVRTTGFGYSDSKVYAEAVVRSAGRDGLACTIVRPATIYGPRSETLVLQIAVRLRRRRMLLVDDGQQDAGLAYVDNVVDLLLAAAVSPRAVGETYNACDCDGITWQQYCDRLAHVVGASPCRTYLPFRVACAVAGIMERTSLLLGRRQRPLLTRTAVHILGAPQRHQNDKARRDLGWQPRVTFDAAFVEIHEWLSRTL